MVCLTGRAGGLPELVLWGVTATTPLRGLELRSGTAPIEGVWAYTTFCKNGVSHESLSVVFDLKAEIHDRNLTKQELRS